MNPLPCLVAPPVRRPAARSLAGALGALLLLGAGALLAPGAWAAAPPGQSWVRAAHAVPGLAGMTFTVTGGPDQVDRTLAEDAPYGTVGDYDALPPGRYTAAVRPPGQPTVTPVLTTTFTVGPSSATTLAAIGTTSAPRLATLTDDLTPPPAGQARVRVLPGASGAPTVDVRAQNGPVIADGAVFGQASAYADVPAGPWTLDLSGGGKSSTATVELAAGGVYTVAITDDDDGGLRALPVTDALGTAQAGAAPGGAAPPADGAGAAGAAGRCRRRGPGRGRSRRRGPGRRGADRRRRHRARRHRRVRVAVDPGGRGADRRRRPRAAAGSAAARPPVRPTPRAGHGDRGAPARPGLLAARAAAASVLLGAALAGCSGAAGAPTSSAGVGAPERPAAASGPAPSAAPVPVPADPADPTAGLTPEQVAAARPAHLLIPRIGVDTPLVDLGVDADGALEVPSVDARAGWFTRSALPGARGPEVIAGHVDGTEGPAVFYRLRELAPGDEITVVRGDGAPVTYRVDGVEQHPKNAFPTAAVYGPAPGAVLRVITCGGSFDRASGHYRDNTVVFATLAG